MDDIFSSFKFNTEDELTKIIKLLQDAHTKSKIIVEYETLINEIKNISHRKNDIDEVIKDILDNYSYDDDYSLEEAAVDLCYSDPEKINNINREQLVFIVNKLIVTENMIEMKFYLNLLKNNVICPYVSDFIFNPKRVKELKGIDPVTPEIIVDKILEYKPIFL